MDKESAGLGAWGGWESRAEYGPTLQTPSTVATCPLLVTEHVSRGRTGCRKWLFPSALAPNSVQILLNPAVVPGGCPAFIAVTQMGKLRHRGVFFLILSFAMTLWGLGHWSGFRPKVPGQTVLEFP